MLPFPLFLLTMADYLTGAIIRRSWTGLWLYMFHKSITSTGLLILNFFYDSIIILVFLLLPVAAMLVRASCPKSANALLKRFVLLELPFLALWELLFFFLLFSRVPPGVLTSSSYELWGQVASSSLAVQYISLVVVDGELLKSLSTMIAGSDKR